MNPFMSGFSGLIGLYVVTMTGVSMVSLFLTINNSSCVNELALSICCFDGLK